MSDLQLDDASVNGVAISVQQLTLNTIESLRACKRSSRHRLSSKRVSRSYGGVASSGPLYDVMVPGSKKAIQYLLWYASQDALRIASVSPSTTDLVVSVDLLFSQVTVRSVYRIPYANEPLRLSVLKGEWMDLGNGVQVRFDASNLLPTVTKQGDGCVLSWSRPPIVRWKRFLFKWIELSIDRIIITQTGGRVETTSRLANYIIPDLTWGE